MYVFLLPRHAPQTLQPPTRMILSALTWAPIQSLPKNFPQNFPETIFEKDTCINCIKQITFYNTFTCRLRENFREIFGENFREVIELGPRRWDSMQLYRRLR